MSVQSLSISVDSFQSSLQPPSTSLSPLSKIKYYQQQIEQAHNLIDYLEITIEDHQKNPEKENLNNQNISSLSVVHNPQTQKINHQKISSLRLQEIDTEQLFIKQYNTPREFRSQEQLCLPPLSQRNKNPRLTETIKQLQKTHNHFLSNARTQNLFKSSKIDDLKNLIQSLQGELHQAVQQREIIMHRENYQNRNIDCLTQEISWTAQQLEISKQNGTKLENLLAEFEIQENTEKAQSEETNSGHQGRKKQTPNQKSLKRKRMEYNRMHITSTKRLQDKVQEMKQQIQEIQESKLLYQKIYEDKIKMLEDELAKIKSSQLEKKTEEQLKIETPNKKNIIIYNPEIKLARFQVEKSVSNQTQRIDTLDDLRIKTDQDCNCKLSQKCLQHSDNFSVKSFKSEKLEQKIEQNQKVKRRNCEICQIF